MSMIAETGASLAREGSLPKDAERIVREIHRMLRDSIQPTRPPTSDEVRERAGLVVRMAPRLMEAGFTEDDVAELLRAVLARVIEAHFSERIVDTLSDSSVFRPARSRGGFGRFSHFAVSDG